VLMAVGKKVPAIVEAWYPGEMDAAVARRAAGRLQPRRQNSRSPFPKKSPIFPPARRAISRRERCAQYSEGVMVGYRWYAQQ